MNWFFLNKKCIYAAPPSTIGNESVDLSLISDLANEDISDEIEKNVSKFQCVINSFEDAIKGTKYVYLKSQWEITKKDFEILFNRINACKEIQDKTEQRE